MAVPTTHSDLKTRAIAVRTELDELWRGAHTLTFSGTDAQKAGAAAMKTELREPHKNMQKAAFGAALSQLT
jgi:hypothetical protein